MHKRKEQARRLLSAVCAFVLAVSLVPVAWAGEDTAPVHDVAAVAQVATADTPVQGASGGSASGDADAALAGEGIAAQGTPAPTGAADTTAASDAAAGNGAAGITNGEVQASAASGAYDVSAGDTSGSDTAAAADAANTVAARSDTASTGATTDAAASNGSAAATDDTTTGDATTAATTADATATDATTTAAAAATDVATTANTTAGDAATDATPASQNNATSSAAQPAVPSTKDATATTTAPATIPSVQPATTEPLVINSTKPSSYDARDEGLISPVRLQDPWGACWAFASLAAMEANLVKQGLLSADEHLSTRHLIYFAGTPAQGIGAQEGEGQYAIEFLQSLFGDNAAFELGGHSQEIASAISSGEGVVLESDYPYRNDEGSRSASGKNYSIDGTWSLDESARYDSAFTLRNMHLLPTPGQFAATGDLVNAELDGEALDAVKQAILDYGAISASYNSSNSTTGGTNYYNATYATFFTNETTAIDHDICIVGWDDDFPRERFTTGIDGTLPEGNGAWIVKNSWGAASNRFPNANDWGEDGYCYISYYDRSIQGFTAWEMMAQDDPDATSITHQHDYMGQRSNSTTRVTEANPQAFANTFVAEVAEKVRAVAINTYAQRSQVSIKLYLLDDDALQTDADPTRGSMFWSKDLVVPWAGYHRIQLDKPYALKAGQRFSVVVSMVEVDEEGNRVYVASIEAGNNPAAVGLYGLSHFDVVVCNPGETQVLVTIDGKQRWIDGAEYAKMLHEAASDQAYYGNACIKVFADPIEEPEPVPPPEPIDPPEPTKPSYNHKPVQISVAKAQAPSTYAPTALAATADLSGSLVVLLLICAFASGVACGLSVLRNRA